MKLTMAVVAAALAMQPAASATAQSLDVGLARFYRSAGRQTVVDGFCRVPFGALDSLTHGLNAAAVYRIEIVVRDSAKLQLVQQSWTRSIPARLLATPRGSSLEHFTFAATPGAYTVEVAVRDSASGRMLRAQQGFKAFATPPAASDLLLATGMRVASGGDTTLQPGELRKGGIVLQAAEQPLLTPAQAQLGYYLEWYGQRAETAAVSVRVLRADSSALVSTPAQQELFGAGGGVTHGMVDLAGLPAGDFTFQVVVKGKDTSVARGAPFRMGGIESMALTAPPPPAAAPDMFEGKTEAQLDSLYAPLIYVMTSDEAGIYTSLTPEGKRTFLRRFWAKRDPGFEGAFYSRIAEANRRYREGGAARIPGWRTDRGRIFVKYGPPSDVMSRPQAATTLPYEVWKYSQGRSLKYVFMDMTQFGNYTLIWTDDRREPSRPDWESLLGPAALQDVERF